MGINLNIILISLASLLSAISFISGALLVARSFFGFRARINAAMNTDLEIIRVAKENKRADEGRLQNAPEAWKEEIGAMEQLLTSISGIKERRSLVRRMLYGIPQVTLEIANPSSAEEIYFYIAVPKKFRDTIEKQVTSYFPGALIEKVEDYTLFTPYGATATSMLTLKKSHALPIRTYEKMDVDPLNEISNALSKLQTVEEGACVQVVLAPAPQGWRALGRAIARKMQQGKHLSEVYQPTITGKILKGMGDLLHSTRKKPEQGMQKETDQLTPEEQDLVKAIGAKTNKQGFCVNVRLLASAATQERAEEILAQLENAFSQFEDAQANHFQIKKRLSKKQTVFHYIFRTYSEENTMILNTEEIASIFHFPISTTETPKIKWLKSGSAPPPAHIPIEGIVLGNNDYRGVKTPVRLSADDRRRHLYVIGQTGTGKSTFLQEMVKQDVQNGNGVCFIDPHGDAIEDILASLPKERAEDVIYFDPSDSERPFGLNMLEFSRPEEKTFVVNEMINIFDKLYDLRQTGGPMFEQYMRNAMLLVMEHPESGSTLMEIPMVLSDENFRRYKLDHCANPVVKDFWIKEAEKAGGEAALANIVPYVTSKLTSFISNDMMRAIIAQQKSTINFRDAMDQKKILLINLSKGKIGEVNSYLLGMVIVGKLLMAALSRVDLPQEKRKDFYLYIDEFQNVTTDSIAQILSEARKYRLNLVIAHQFIGQLTEEISKAVFGNVGSLASFRIGPEDAEFLEKQFEPVFSANDLINVDNYNCFVRLLINNETTKPFNMKTISPTKGNQELVPHLKELSRLRFGRDAKLVHQEILERTKIGRETKKVAIPLPEGSLL